jgi:hypothetical protein
LHDLKHHKPPPKGGFFIGDSQMALAYKATLRQARLDAITTAAGSAALLRIYNGTRPATNGTATTLLAECICGTPFAGAAAGSTDGSPTTLTLTVPITDSSANATGTASWFRVVKADGTTFVMDGDCGTSGSDLNLTTLSIVALQPVSVTSFVLTEGNP